MQESCTTGETVANKSAIGTVLGTVTFPVERGKVKEMAQAVLADDPAYLDPDTPGGLLAPPTFLQTIAWWEPPGGPAFPDLGIDFLRIMHGEQEFDYLAPIHVGDELTATSVVADIYDKTNSRGQTLWFLVFENRFANQDGVDVARSRMVLIETPAPEAT